MKQNLRNRLKARRALFHQAQQGQLASVQGQLRDHVSRLCENLCEGAKSKEIWSYMAYGDEALAQPLSRGLQIAYPRVVGSDLEFYFSDPKHMKTSAWGIREPIPQKSKPAREPQLILVPGLGFDRTGGRIGSGKGFYDRLLGKFSKAIRIGVAYSAQVVSESLPLEKHDQSMDWLVTENYILQCQRKD